MGRASLQQNPKAFLERRGFVPAPSKSSTPGPSPLRTGGETYRNEAVKRWILWQASSSVPSEVA